MGNEKGGCFPPESGRETAAAKGKTPIAPCCKRGQWGFPKRSRKKFLSAQKFFREYIHGVAPVSIADARKSKHAEERVASIKHSA